MEEIELKTKRKRQINPDRIVLESASVETVKTIASQIENTFGGIIKLTQKEMANFLLQSRKEPLTATELMAIKDKYFDDVQAAHWALQKLKAAKESGQELTLADVLGQLQTPLVKEKRKPKVPKVKSEKVYDDLPRDQMKQASIGPSGSSKEAIKQPARRDVSI